MSGHRGRHPFGAKGATPEGHLLGHSAVQINVATLLNTARRNGRGIVARSLGEMAHPEGVPLPPLGVPRCTCWCERIVVDVTWDEIAEGVTRSCGTARCDAIARSLT